ncbi:RidA family protein [Nonomuraea typhae]|uniref:RidA family protein n=1 Tax=Nonomuraea typhae TaxID=2603600 RepID=UPI0012F90ED3|nr:Rid family hydrolase [Nonomuraea typhae]
MAHTTFSGDSMPRVLGHYSPAVGSGNLLFLAAQGGIDQETGRRVEGDFAAECRQTIANLRQALRGCGADLTDVVRTTVFYTDLANLEAINEVYRETFPADPPARSAVIVQLPGGMRVSIDAIAVLPD